MKIFWINLKKKNLKNFEIKFSKLCRKLLFIYWLTYCRKHLPSKMLSIAVNLLLRREKKI